jgi:hypothetical protein
MVKRADVASCVDRLVWRRSLELLQTYFRTPVSSGVLTTLGFLAAAFASVEICSHASVPDHSSNFSPEEVLADTEMLLAPDAPTSVSVVPKLPRSLPTPGSQADLSIPHNAMTNANTEAPLFSGETVSSKMLMMGFSMAPTAAATAPVSPVTPSAVTPRPKLKRQTTVQKLQAVQQPPQPKPSWWQRFPWISLP